MRFSESLKKNADFRIVYRKGKSFGNRLLVLYAMRNGTGTNRLGISVSKKVGNSVVRHRLTRLVRESYRLHEEEFKEGLDLVVVGKPAAKGASYSEIESALLHVCKKQDVLKA